MSGFTIEGGNVVKQGIWTGDIIEYQGVRYKITKINPKNYKLMRENDGQTFNLNQNAYGIKRAEDQDWKGPKEKTPWDLANETASAGLVLGSTVKLTGAAMKRKYGADTVWVVIAKAGDGTMRITKLGGWGDTYLRKITADMVEVA